MRKFNFSNPIIFYGCLLIAVIIIGFIMRFTGVVEEPNTGETGVEIIDNVITLNPERKDLEIKITGAEGLYFYEPEENWLLPVTQIIIQGEEDEEICVLDWSTGELEFRGKMSSSARSFFKYFLKPHVDSYIDSKLSEFVNQKLEEGRKKNDKQN